VELLPALVGPGVEVRATVDGLGSSSGILERHLLILVILLDSLLLALPLPRRCAITMRLQLLLLAELLHKLLDLPALLSSMALGVAYQAPWTTLIAIGGLSRPLVTTWAMAPTSCSSCSTGQRLVFATSLLLLATALSSGVCIRFVIFPYLGG
jgi:hypothetical protein